MTTAVPLSLPPSSSHPVPLHCDDLSRFAKALRAQLLQHHARDAAPPGHLSLLNMLARAAGHRNLQTLQACAPDPATPGPRPGPGAGTGADAWADSDAAHLPCGADAPGEPSPPLSANAAKALTQFDAWGRLARWPHKFSVQRLAMWVLWTRFDAGRLYREAEVNQILKAWTTWGDHVTPRRELVEMGLLARESDCSAYWKLPQQPGDEVRGLLRAVRRRRPAAAVHRSAARPGAGTAART